MIRKHTEQRNIRILGLIPTVHIVILKFQTFKAMKKEPLLDFIISFPFIKDGPVYPVLKQIRKAALKHLSIAFRVFNQLLSWLPPTIH